MSKVKNALLTFIGTIIALLIHRLSIAILTLLTAVIHQLPHPPGIAIQVAVSCIPQIYQAPGSSAYVISIIAWAASYGVSAYITHLFVRFFSSKTLCNPRPIRLSLLFLVGIAAFGSITVPTEGISIIGLALGAAVFVPSFAFLRNNH